MKAAAKFKLKVKRSLTGLGLFAEEMIPKHRTIIEYVGYRIHTRVGDAQENRNRYIFNVNMRWDIDGSPRWNTARYINHSCRPNCEAVNRRGRIFIVSRRIIRAGEELVYDYGQDYFENVIGGKRHCRCVKCKK